MPNLDMEVTESQIVVASIDDLLREILVRLPLRPLFRFKSVSKHWNSLISDPKLHYAFNQKPNPAAGLIFQSPHRRCPPLVVTFGKSSTTYKPTTKEQSNVLCRLNFKALNSCNGLLICASKNDHDHGSYPQQCYYVCNPTTGNYFTLRGLGRRKWLEGICLAFDPAKSPHYSVVCAFAHDEILWDFELWYELEVFSSETGRWRKIGEPFNAHADFRSGVYWNGCVHWISTSDKSIYLNPNEQTPALKFMPTPPLLSHFYNHSFEHSYYFGESGGHLNFIENAYECGAECIVQEMREDYSEWFVKYRVDLNLLSTIPRALDLDCYSIRALDRGRYSMRALVRGEKDEDSFLVFVIGRLLIRLNIFYNTLETIGEFEEADAQYYDLLEHRRFPCQYIESCCPVHHKNKNRKSGFGISLRP